MLLMDPAMLPQKRAVELVVCTINLLIEHWKGCLKVEEVGFLKVEEVGEGAEAEAEVGVDEEEEGVGLGERYANHRIELESRKIWYRKNTNRSVIYD